MILRATTDYSIRIMAFLAKCGKVSSSTEIAKNTHISSKYIIKIAALLRDHNLITSSHGMGGGYTLARPANEISMWDIIRSVEPELCADDKAGEFVRSAPNTTESDLARDMFEEINKRLRDYFIAITLADFVSQSQNHARGGKDNDV